MKNTQLYYIFCSYITEKSMLFSHHSHLQPATSAWASFAAGAFTASFAWSLGWCAHNNWSIPRMLLATWCGDYESDDDSVLSENDIDSNSENSQKASRKENSRWPWDKIRKRVLNVSASFLNTEITGNFQVGNSSEIINSAERKTGPCIGAIFGLDVGGTLTKLVYFEQQIQEYKRPGFREGLHRQDHYHAAASASEVLHARRSSSLKMTRHNTDSEKDLEGLMRIRQESVPDRLNEFASSCNIASSPSIIPSFEQSEISSFDRGNGLKKASSMVNLSKSNEHKEALDNFYSFARRLDAYDTGMKDKHLSYYSRFLNGQFHFIRFETRRMKNAMNLMRINNFHLNIKEIGSTGGGSHKFANDWERELGITMKKQDEMDSLVAGMQFVMSDIVGECYTFKPINWNNPNVSGHSDINRSDSNASDTKTLKTSNKTSSTFSASEILLPVKDPIPVATNDENTNDSREKRPTPPHHQKENGCCKESQAVDKWWASKKVQRDSVIDSNAYPYLLVSIGTGVSILRVDGPRKHERISGSTIGGGTYWGLCRLLTGSDSFSDVLNLAMKGDPSKVDMMVGDIYGENSNALEKMGLSSNLVASSFGKLVAKRNPSEGVKEEDLARALLLMVTNNIGQVAYLNAQLHKTSRIYFVGTFLQHNTISQQRLAYAIDYWSKGETEALFLEHEGYFGALGAFLLNQGIKHHIDDNYGSRLRKKRPSKSKIHLRSKSMGSINVSTD
ncbi:hypothetical protein ACHAXS_010349 [Conticribra weissflogii]